MRETMEADGGNGLQAVAIPALGSVQGRQTPMPAGVKYLVGTELASRFSIKSIQAVLALFLFEHLRLSENTSTKLVHVFLTVLDFSPMVGALLSDGYLGKYHTFFCFGCLQLAGNGILSLAAVFGVETEMRSTILAFTALGLLLTAVGGGAVKPCITSFGGDQVEELVPKGADRVRLMSLFFSLYYVAMNAGSLISTVSTPAIRTVGSYAWIFSLACAFAGVYLFIFWLGSRHYIHRPVKENTFGKVAKIIVDAIRFRISKRVHRIAIEDAGLQGEGQHFLAEDEIEGDNGDEKTLTTSEEAKHQSWLDGAKLNHDAALVEDVKALLRVLVLFCALPVFWGLFDQQFSKWVFQARSLNCEVHWLGGLVLQPDQMPALNPLLVLVLIPIFDHGIYPFFAKLNMPLAPLQKMVIGMSMAVLAFLASGALQLAMDFTVTSTPTAQSTSKLSVFWQLPQYVLITAGEVLLNVTGLEFAYSQAPPCLKSVVQGALGCTSAIGNLMTFATLSIMGERVSRANEFFIFAGGCAAATLMQIWISHGYDYGPTTVPAHPDPLHAETMMTV